MDVSYGTATASVQTSSPSINGAQSGAYFLEVVTSNSPNVYVYQSLSVAPFESFSCGGYFNFPGNTNGDSTRVRASIRYNGDYCAEGSWSNTNGWVAIDGGEVFNFWSQPIQVVVYISFDNPSSYPLSLGFDSASFLSRRNGQLPECGLEPPPTSSTIPQAVTVSSTTSATVLPTSTSSGTSAMDSTSIVQTFLPSSTASTPPSPSCATNRVSNLGFENGLADWTWSSISSDSYTVNAVSQSTTIQQPYEGTRFLVVGTSSIPVVTLRQSLTGLSAGDRVSCSAFYNYRGATGSFTIYSSIDIAVDGQVCSTAVTYSSAGWVETSPLDPVTLTHDNPEVTITIGFNNGPRDDLEWGVDNVRVIPVIEDGLPECSPGQT